MLFKTDVYMFLLSDKCLYIYIYKKSAMKGAHTSHVTLKMGKSKVYQENPYKNIYVKKKSGFYECKYM